MKHLNIRIFGKVQGVFFRYYAEKEARSLGLTGFIRNEPDSTVYYDARIPRCSASGMKGRRKGIGGAETARKIPTPIPRCKQRGWVYIEAEGEEKNLNKFLKWCGKGPDTAQVEKVEFVFSADMNNFTEFKVF